MSLDVQINLTTLSKTVQSVPLSDTLNFKIELIDASFDSRLDLALNEQLVHELTLADLTHNTSHGCVLNAVDVFNISSFLLNMTTGTIKFTAATGGSLEKDIDDTIDTIFDFITEAFNPTLPALVNAIGTQPIAKIVNAAFATAKKNAVCEPRAVTTDEEDVWKWAKVAATGLSSIFVLVSLVVVRQQFKRKQQSVVNRMSVNDDPYEMNNLLGCTCRPHSFICCCIECTALACTLAVVGVWLQTSDLSCASCLLHGVIPPWPSFFLVVVVRGTYSFGLPPPSLSLSVPLFLFVCPCLCLSASVYPSDAQLTRRLVKTTHWCRTRSCTGLCAMGSCSSSSPTSACSSPPAHRCPCK